MRREDPRIDMRDRFDSPDRYVDLLSNFGQSAQIIEHHLHCFTGGQCTPGYACLPEKSFKAIEGKVTTVAEFIGDVVVNFIIDDTKQFIVSTSSLLSLLWKMKDG